MATGSQVRAGAAYVELLLKDAALLAGLKAAGNKLKSWGAGIAKIGAAVGAAGGGILAPLVMSVNKFAEVGTELQHVSEITGMSVKDLAGLKKLAGESGISFEELTTDLNKFQQNLGSGKAADALRKIGVAAGDLNGKEMSEQLATVADAFAKLQDPALKAAMARELFGRGSRNFIAVLNRGGDAMREYMDASKLWAEGDGERAQEFTRNEKRITGAIDAVKISLGGAIVEAFGSYLEPIVKGAKAVAEWVREHRQIAVTAAVVGASLVGIAGVVTGISIAFATAGLAASGFAAVMGVILSPTVLIGAAIAALVGGMIYLATISEKIKPSLNELGEGFMALKGRAVEAFGGMADAFKAGDLVLAVEIGWNLIQREFLRGIKAVRIAWSEMIDALAKQWEGFARAVKVVDAQRKKGAAENAMLDELAGKGAAPDLGKIKPGLTDDLDKRINALDRARKQMIEDAAKKRRKDVEWQPKADSMAAAAAMGIGEAAKGTFSPYAISQALAHGEKVNERIAQSTERTADGVAKMNEKLDKLPGRAPVFKDDGG